MKARLLPSFSALGIRHLLAASGLSLVLTACDKPQPPPKAAVAPAPAPVPQETQKIDSQIAGLLSSIPDPVQLTDQDIEERVTDIMERHPDKNAQDLLSVPEVNEKLRSVLVQLSKLPDLQKNINSTVDIVAAVKGMAGPPGSHRMVMDMKQYAPERTRRLLTAVMSDSPRRVANFVMEELGEASFEFAMANEGGKSTNGISLEPVPPAPGTTAPAPPQAPTDPTE